MGGAIVKDPFKEGDYKSIVDFCSIDVQIGSSSNVPQKNSFQMTPTLKVDSKISTISKNNSLKPTRK